MEPGSLIRVTVTLEAADVELLDRLAELEGLNRSAELRGLLAQLRPMIRQTVEAFSAAHRYRETLDRAAADVPIGQLEELLPEVERLQAAYLGALARIEGLAAASAAHAGEDPRPSNHGGHTPTPTPPPDA